MTTSSLIVYKLNEKDYITLTMSFHEASKLKTMLGYDPNHPNN